jgi:hypothetical protein
MGFADALKEKEKKQSQLTSIVSEDLERWMIGLNTLDEGRKPGFHPSNIFYTCPRAYILEKLLPGSTKEPIDPNTRAKFDIGHSVHAWYQNKYLGPIGTLKGSWKCSHCDKVVEGFMPKTHCPCISTECDTKCIWKSTGIERTCQICYKRPNEWLYQEPHVYSEEFGFGGHMDGIIVRNEQDYVIDIKTIETQAFSKLTMAQDAHKYQVNIYMWFSGIPRGFVLYVDKSSKGPLPFKEFMVKYDSSIQQDVRRKIDLIQKCETDKVLPSCEGKFCKCSKVPEDTWKPVVEAWQRGEVKI